MKQTIIPFRFCSIERAARLLSEAIGQRVEVEDFCNLLDEGAIRGCLDFGVDSEYAMDIHSFVDVEWKSDEQWDRELAEKTEAFLDRYCATLEGERYPYLCNGRWSDDAPLSGMSSFTGIELNLGEEDEGGRFVTATIIPNGVWEIEHSGYVFNFYSLIAKNGVAKCGADDEHIYGDIDFKRIPSTEYNWGGTLIDEEAKEIRAEQVVIWCEDLKDLINKFDPKLKVKTLDFKYKAPQQVRQMLPGSMLPAPRATAQQSDLIVALIDAMPELSEKFYSSIKEDRPSVLVEHLDSLKLGLNLPELDVKSLSNWLDRARINPNPEKPHPRDRRPKRK